MTCADYCSCGVIKGAESFQLLFADDTDSNGVMDRWAKAGDWSDTGQLLGVRIGVLLAADDPVKEPDGNELQVLDSRTLPRGDGRLRRVFEFDVAIRSSAG